MTSTSMLRIKLNPTDTDRRRFNFVIVDRPPGCPTGAEPPFSIDEACQRAREYPHPQDCGEELANLIIVGTGLDGCLKAFGDSAIGNRTIAIRLELPPIGEKEPDEDAWRRLWNLHWLPWECLPWKDLTGHPAVSLVRYIPDAGGNRDIDGLWSLKAPRVLFAAANPRDSADFNVSPIEPELIRDFLDDSNPQYLPVTNLGAHVRPDMLVREAGRGYHALCLVAHGKADPSGKMVVLLHHPTNHENGKFITVEELVGKFQALGREIPPLIVLLSCHSTGNDESQLGLAQALLQKTPVRAVFATRGPIPQDLAFTFAKKLFTSIQNKLSESPDAKLHIEAVASAARYAGKLINEQHWSNFVLYSKVLDGAIWGAAPGTEDLVAWLKKSSEQLASPHFFLDRDGEQRLTRYAKALIRCKALQTPESREDMRKEWPSFHSLLVGLERAREQGQEQRQVLRELYNLIDEFTSEGTGSQDQKIILTPQWIELCLILLRPPSSMYAYFAKTYAAKLYREDPDELLTPARELNKHLKENPSDRDQWIRIIAHMARTNAHDALVTATRDVLQHSFPEPENEIADRLKRWFKQVLGRDLVAGASCSQPTALPAQAPAAPATPPVITATLMVLVRERLAQASDCPAKRRIWSPHPGDGDRLYETEFWLRHGDRVSDLKPLAVLRDPALRLTEIPACIGRALTIVADLPHAIPPEALAVELFLPSTLIARTAFESMETPAEDGPPVPLGVRHLTLQRLIERLEDGPSGRHEAWRRFWEHVQAQLAEVGLSADAEYFHWHRKEYDKLEIVHGDSPPIYVQTLRTSYPDTTWQTYCEALLRHGVTARLYLRRMEPPQTDEDDKLYQRLAEILESPDAQRAFPASLRVLGKEEEHLYTRFATLYDTPERPTAEQRDYLAALAAYTLP